ncbi:MAG: Monofunctional biosynthetic peptidoglycan transglycosylase [Candidatus Angelobacter sp.]|jgi:membrane carboxypeptidase/penicillin-binding protein|nr:Monofunctional biosynthetic peptidoglycan transglycosylase [Candidatus Angelobacter sp.]
MQLAKLARGLIKALPRWSRDFQALVTELQGTRIPQLSENLSHSLVIAEDHRFWTHGGVDLRAVGRALIRTLIFRKCEGASTIHQQLVRVTTGRYERTLRRKIREMIFAVALDDSFKKEEILSFYLVKGYYGWKMTGLLAACDLLRISPIVATPFEAASLISRMRYPEPRNASAMQKARIERRTMHILNRWKLGEKPDSLISHPLEQHSQVPTILP